MDACRGSCDTGSRAGSVLRLSSVSHSQDCTMYMSCNLFRLYSTTYVIFCIPDSLVYNKNSLFRLQLRGIITPDFGYFNRWWIQCKNKKHRTQFRRFKFREIPKNLFTIVKGKRARHDTRTRRYSECPQDNVRLRVTVTRDSHGTMTVSDGLLASRQSTAMSDDTIMTVTVMTAAVSL